MNHRRPSCAFFLFFVAFLGAGAHSREAVGAQTLQTQHARVEIDDRGWITSLQARPSGKEYAPAKHPSPLMSLHEEGRPNDKLVYPTAAVYRPEKREIELKYPNGATAVIKAEAKDAYLRFQLVSLEPRGTVDTIVWGPINTTISGKIGDLVGVVRDDDWAIGLYGLDDNTISGPVVDGDCYSMGYIVHSPDPAKHPLPPDLKEGQWFNIGGNGVSDTAFFSRPEEYFQYVCGTGAKVEPEFGSSIAYHARDRRKPHVHFWSLLPGFERSRPRHMVSDPIPGVDFLGSAVALYACPDELGLKSIEQIIRTEGLPYVTDRDGIWIRDPASYRATLYWNGPVDKAIEYTKALGLKDISRDTGEFYPSMVGEFIKGKGFEKIWPGRIMSYSDGRQIHYKEFGELARKEGLTHGGLHAMCVFLNGGNAQVRPPSEHLQTICRTKLAKDISETDTEIVVTDPSFLAEKGTWAMSDGSNFLRIGSEMLRYEGISESAPWTLQGVQRGHASKAAAHQAGDELVKLQQNVYNGFLPDMTLLLEYADYYASLMHQNGMDTIDFDGFESLVGTNHGYYAVRVFCRRLFETYHDLTGGKWPRVTTSNVFPGAWEYLNVCNIGGGSRMLNPVTGRRAIQGKDIGNGWSNSYFPATFGKQGWDSSWSLYDAENLEAKAVGWDATYALIVSQELIDRTGERDEIFKAFPLWQIARAQQLFSKEMKQKLRDPDYKFHLTQTDEKTLVLQTLKETKVSGTPQTAAAGEAAVANPYDVQPLQFALCITGPVSGCVITLPGGGQIKSDHKMEAGQFIICKGQEAYVADKFRKKIAGLELAAPAVLRKGESKFRVQYPDARKPRFDLTVWALDKGETIVAGK